MPRRSCSARAVSAASAARSSARVGPAITSAKRTSVIGSAQAKSTLEDGDQPLVGLGRHGVTERLDVVVGGFVGGVGDHLGRRLLHDLRRLFEAGLVPTPLLLVTLVHRPLLHGTSSSCDMRPAFGNSRISAPSSSWRACTAWRFDQLEEGQERRHHAAARRRARRRGHGSAAARPSPSGGRISWTHSSTEISS